MYIYIFWVNCNDSRPHCDLTGIMVNKGNHPQMALIQASEILHLSLYITHIIHICMYVCIGTCDVSIFTAEPGKNRGLG